MKYPWINDYLLAKPGVTRNDDNWNWQRYMLEDKMFAAVCLDDSNKPYYITLKLEPLEGEALRSQYEDILPGYYMNKLHWNSIRADGSVPDDLMHHMLDEAYRLVLKSFSKKKQAELTGGEPT